MADFRILLDAPDQPTGRLQIAKVGSFTDKRYGKFDITPADVQDWKRNLEHLPGKRALIDLDHAADRSPRNTEAAGWITGIDLDGDTPVATVEWTPVGKQAIADKRYLFFSPTYGQHKTEDGTVHENTLIGGALTNRPFLNMPAIQLASEERFQEALEAEPTVQLYLERAAESELRGTADSRPAMNPELLKTLGLAEDADDQTVLDAVTQLATKAAETEGEKPEVKTLEQQAADAGKVLLDSAQLADLSRKADAGEKAAKELAATRFETSFEKAVAAGRAIPAQKEQLQHFYTLDAEATIKSLDEGPQIVNVKPSGWNNSRLELEDAPAGVDADSHKLDQAVKTRLRELGKPMSEYPVVLEQIMQEGAV